MGYMHIENLYKNQLIMLFKKCYALEKVDGTSAHISFNFSEKKLSFFTGGSHALFLSLFDQAKLLEAFVKQFDQDVIVYGEHYAGKEQGMGHVYGQQSKFIGFDVKVGETWLNVPNATDVCDKLGLEFVSWVEIDATVEAVNAERDKDSIQAIRNGMGSGHKREGVVLRPLFEMLTSNGERVMSKHKGDHKRETNTSREISPDKLKVLENAQAVATEWVTAERFEHVMQKLPQAVDMKSVPIVIAAMVEDVYREGKGEIVESNEVKVAIGKATVPMFKRRLDAAIK